jgi:hypothetical protein
MLQEILSHLPVRDLFAMAQVSRWMYSVISPLRLNYLVLSIKRITEPNPRKILIHTEQTCTYTQLRKKLMLQLPHKKAWQKEVQRVIHENNASLDNTVEAMKAIVGILFVACIPLVGGSALDLAKINISNYLFGLSGFQVGYGLTFASLSSFTAWMLKVCYDNKDDNKFQSVQLIQEDSILVSLSRN